MSPLRLALALAVALAALAALACIGSPGDGSPPHVVCRQDDIPPGFFRQMEGEFTLRDLADRHPEPRRREADLRAAGALDGHLSYWAEVVERPPFDPPTEILCQAVRFESAAQATAFVAALGPGEVAATAMAWLPGDDRTVEELSLDGADLWPGARAFRVVASDDAARVTLYAVVAANGRYVHTVMMGGRAGRTALEDAVAVHVSLAGRSAGAAR